MNDFDEMPCKLESTERPRSFKKHLTSPWGEIGYFSNGRGFSVDSSLQGISSNSFLWKRNNSSKCVCVCVCERAYMFVSLMHFHMQHFFHDHIYELIYVLALISPTSRQYYHFSISSATFTWTTTTKNNEGTSLNSTDSTAFHSMEWGILWRPGS